MTTDCNLPLVTTDWVAARLDDPAVRMVDVDIDAESYADGHIRGAVGWNWTTQLQDQVRRDVVSKSDFERLMSESGIRREDCVVLYGNSNNWFAAYGFWLLKLYGHKDVRLLDGGRRKWLKEYRHITRAVPHWPKTAYVAEEMSSELRVMRDRVLASIGNPEVVFVDVRTLDEYDGWVTAPFGSTESAQRGGHIPGAVNIAWDEAVNMDDQSLWPRDFIRDLYEQEGVTPDKEVITYCRIGERAAFTWFVLTYVLGYPRVRVYDGSWAEWGNLVGVPIEKKAKRVRALEDILNP